MVVSAGSLRPPDGVVMPHRWTSEGVVVQTEFTGAHLYHLAAASCILNDVYRESDRLGFVIDGGACLRIRWLRHLDVGVVGSRLRGGRSLRSERCRHRPFSGVVDEVAEIPKALRLGTTVVRRTRDLWSWTRPVDLAITLTARLTAPELPFCRCVCSLGR